MSLTQLGRFKITGILGQGAMGTVYRAHDPLIDRTVAIKTVAYAGLSHEEAVAFEERFYCEAKSAGRLNHPNIVTIHDVGRSNDLAYIAMEFLDGRNLREILDSGVVLPVERSAEIAALIADGLAFAHANGVVHRDIKPANIMVFDNGTVKIADFGVALMPSGAKTVAGTAFGSPKYMSPEQVTGAKVDGRSDIFALGAVLYEMLVGRAPFTGDDLNAVLYQVLNAAPPLPSTYIPNLPHGFDRIVARALAKNPDKRFQNAADMAASLRKYRRIAKQAQKELLAATPPASSTSPGDATLLVKTIPVQIMAATKPSGRALRYAVPLLLLTLFAGWLLLRPTATTAPGTEAAAAPPAETPRPQLAASDAGQAANPPLAEPIATPATPVAEPAAEPPATPIAEPAAEPLAAPAAGPVSKPAAPAVADGQIRLAIAPWGEVYIDGKMVGVSPPLNEVRLPVGKHRIEIRNGTFVPHRQDLEVGPDSKLRIKHKFE